MSYLHLLIASCRAHRIYSRISPSTRSVARWYSTPENLDVSHAHFLAEASPKSKWTDDDRPDMNRVKASQDELEGVADGRGKLSPTSSHLFKLILPLGNLSHPSNPRKFPEDKDLEHKHKHTHAPEPQAPPTVFLLHPSQPLSHVSRLILASLSPATPSISFRSKSSGGRAFQWSDSTDLGDFIRDAARAAEFTICISYGPKSSRNHHLPASNQENSRMVPVDTIERSAKDGDETGITETLLTVTVPTFADRTRYLRRRLNLVEGRLRDMEDLKAKCDAEAHRGARHMAVGGFGMLVVYWAAVARLTFWDFGWDIMEPITYLSGLSTVILGYLWFLYRGREVSYTSVLAQSISTRREALYKSRGLDIEHWLELVSEKKALRSEIGRIARDYEDDEDDDSSLNSDGDDIHYKQVIHEDGMLKDAKNSTTETTKSGKTEMDGIEGDIHGNQVDLDTEEVKGKVAVKTDSAGL